MITIAVTVEHSGQSKDVALTFDPNEPGERLIQAVNTSLGLPADNSEWRVERSMERIEPHRPVGEAAVLHGDKLIAGTGNSMHAVELRRVGTKGPDRILVREGKTTIGRVPGPDGIAIDDPTVSKVHLTLSRTSRGITAHNFSTTNFTFVNGTKIEGDHQLRNGDNIELGDATSFVLVDERPSAGFGSHLKPVGGRLQFNRPPRSVRGMPDRTIEIGNAPDELKSRRFPLALIILPLIVGGVIAIISSNFMFMAFGLLGPMMGTWNWFDDRRSGRSQHLAAVLKYRESLDLAKRNAETLTSEMKTWGEWSSPVTTTLLARARSLSEDLWDRQPGHSDFVDVRVGAGDLRSAARISIAEQGVPELIAEAHDRLSNFSIDLNAAVTVSLIREPILGIVGGGTEDRRDSARALVMQLATRNSPNDVTIAVLGSMAWRWMTWLPHTTPPGGKTPLVGIDTDSSERTLTTIEQLLGAQESGNSVKTPDAARHLVIVVDSPIDLPVSRMKMLVTAATGGAVSVIWLADQRPTLPANAGVFLELGEPAKLRRTAGDQSIVLSQVETVSAELATTTARILAPLSDPGTSDSSSIPDQVGLFDVLGSDVLDPNIVCERWSRARPEELAAPIGIGRSGPLSLSIGNDGDGPHGLVAGTTGSGKSEFVQTFVLSLAASYSPDDLTFLFVDFKGGLTFRDLIGLPHAVGMVRNLDEALALRAKRSLQAETRRRQQILHKHGAVNLGDLRRRAPGDRLPALLIIVDEYAQLAKKLPEFLDGLVDVAETGRALGLHLLLATQSPGQSVSKNIQNCVKYRLSFRLEDSGESMAVLGRGRDASLLPNHAGRGLLRDGMQQLHEFQGAWAGGRTNVEDPRRASAATLYAPKASLREDSGAATDLERVVEAIRVAAEQQKVAIPRRPWLESLAGTLPLADALSSDPDRGERGNSSAPIGRADLPDSQEQPLFFWDLETSQNLLIIGDGSTGKSTTLRTIAAAFCEMNDSTELQVVGIDATGGGLGSLTVLPNTVAVVNGSDQTRLRRVLAYLQRTVAERRSIVGTAGSLRTYRQGGGSQLANVVVLIDGLESLLSSMEVLDAGIHLASFVQLISDGPAMGVHFAMTTEQPQRIPMSISNAVPERLVLRMASRDASNAAGLQNLDLSSLADGRAMSSRTRAEVQLAVVGDGVAVDGLAQAAALAASAQKQRDSGRTDAARLIEPTEILTTTQLPIPSQFGQIALGVDDIFAAPLLIDVSVVPTLIVMGPDLSGRSTVVESVRRTLAHQGAGKIDTVFISGRGDPPMNVTEWSTICDDLASAVAALEARVAALATPTRPLLIAIDDADDLIETPIGGSSEESQRHRRFSAAMDSLVRAGRGAGVVVVLAGRLNTLTRASGWSQRLRQNQQALILAPATLSVTFTDPIFNVTFPRRSDYVSRPGHGVLVKRGVAEVIQLVRL